jgi:hypothetical protein
MAVWLHNFTVIHPERQSPTNPMNPRQLATAHCANIRNGPPCQGIGIRDDGSLFRLWKAKPCDVNRVRCSYFEECVAPSIRGMQHGPTRDSWVKAIWSYLKILKPLEKPRAKEVIFGKFPDAEIERLLALSTRHCGDCQIPVEGSAQYCDPCADKRRRETNRNRQAVV